MSYTIVSPPTATLQNGEIQLTLDTGQSVAVSTITHRASGASAYVRASARQIGASGNTILDANGHPITSDAHHTFTVTEINAATLPACIKDITLLALGEPPLLFGTTVNGIVFNALDAGVMASYSIRSAIDAAAHAGPAIDLGSIL